MINLLVEAKRHVDSAKENGEELLSEKIISLLETKFKKLISEAEKINPRIEKTNSKRGKIKQSVERNLLDRFALFGESILGFMHSPIIPFDNNQGERDIRMIKTKEKISGCFRSFIGSEYFFRGRGYISTLKKNSQSILENLKLALLGRPFIPILNH
jgi:transposase